MTIFHVGGKLVEVFFVLDGVGVKSNIELFFGSEPQIDLAVAAPLQWLIVWVVDLILDMCPEPLDKLEIVLVFGFAQFLHLNIHPITYILFSIPKNSKAVCKILKLWRKSVSSFASHFTL